MAEVSTIKALTEALVKKAREIRIKKAKKAVNDAHVLTVQEIPDKQCKGMLEQQRQARIQKGDARAVAAEWKLIKEVFPRDIRYF